MVPDLPSPTRRQFLGSLTAACVGSTAVLGATTPTALPDVVTDWATRAYPTPPEVTALWRPTVTEAHAREAVTLLADTVAEAERLWPDLETTQRFHGSGGWLADAREGLQQGNYPEALFDAQYGIQFAGEDLGFARANLDVPAADLRTLGDRAAALLDRFDRVAADLRPYRAVVPGRDLAWHYGVERRIRLGRLRAGNDDVLAARDGVDDGDGPDASTFDARAIGSVTGNVLQAQIDALSAERFRDQHATLVDRSGTPYADHLREVHDRFVSAIEGFPTREAVREAYLEDVDRDEEYTPYVFARDRLARWCFDPQYRYGNDDTEDLLVYRTVERSKGLAQRRAHSTALRRLVVETGDDGFDSGHALAAKRRARSTYRSVVGSDPPPLLTRQARRAVEDLQVAKVGFAGSYRRPLWRERLEAYLYALVGRAKLEQYPALYRDIVDPE